MYDACMPNIQVRDVPDDVHRELVRRAELAGQSLQQYLEAQLRAIATAPLLDEVLDEIDAHASGSLSTEEAIDALDRERARR